MLLGLASVAVTLLVLEGLARVVVPGPAAALFSDPELRVRDRTFVERDEQRGFALKRGRYLWDTGKRIVVNEQGFRGSGSSVAPDAELSVLALGDSTTFGWGVGEGEDYPSLLEEALAQHGVDDPSVVNAGVPSYTSSQVRLYLAEILGADRIQPDLVLVSVLWNDIWYSALPNWYPELLVHQQPAPWRLMLYRHSRLLRALLYGDPPEAERADVFNRRALAHYVQNLREMIEVCAAHGVDLAFVAAPFDLDHVGADGSTELDVHYSRAFLVEIGRTFESAARALARKRDVPFIEHGLSLRHLHQRRLFRDFIHPTAAGNRRIAEDVAQALVGDGPMPVSPIGELARTDS